MRQPTFKVRLLQIFITMIILQGAAVIYTFYRQTTVMVLDLSDRITDEIVEKTGERVANYLAAPSSLTRITSTIVEYDNLIASHEAMWEYMWQPLIMTPQLESFFIADRIGNYVQVRRAPRYATRTIDRTRDPVLDTRLYREEDYTLVEQEQFETDWDPRVRPWFMNTGLKKQYYWTDAYIGTTSQKPVIGCSYPVVNDKGDLGGVVCVNIPLESLSHFLATQTISGNSYVFIIDQNDQIVAFPDADAVLAADEDGTSLRLRRFDELDLPHLRAAYAHQDATGEREFVLTHEREEYYISISTIPSSLGIDWRVVTAIPERDLLENVQRIIFRILMVFAVIFLVSIIAIIYISGRITRPIVELSAINEKLKNFDLDLGDEIVSPIREINQMSSSLFGAAAGLNAFKKYVPADLVRNLIATGQEAKVGGSPRQMTMFFSDIEGFTGISEKIASDYLMQHLSEYFDNLSRIVMEHNGTIDKYIGDSIMAFWGAPLENPNSEIDACSAALACQRALESLNEKWRDFNKPVMRTRIGLANGRVVVGNVGSNERINYSVIGDSVNLASRLEGLNKYYGTWIIISDNVYEKIKTQFRCRLVDIVAVVGRKEGTRIYELLGRKDDPLTQEHRNYLAFYEKGLNAYLARDWERALKCFLIIRRKLGIEDKATEMFIRRCAEIRRGRIVLPDDWDGVTRFDSK